MTWRDNLLQGSFRGVPFEIRTSDAGFGRNNILHNFPFQDEPYLEDLGEDTPDYQVEGYIIQRPENDFDYFTNRDELITAMRTKGDGLLIHPFYGELIVGVLGKARFSEVITPEGGIVRFNVNFVISGRKVLPGTVVSAEPAIDAVVGTSKESAEIDFLSNCDTEDEPGFSLESLASNISTGIKMIRSSINSIKETVDSTVSTAISTLSSLQSNLDSIIDSPADIGNSIVSAFDIFTDLVAITDDTLDPDRISNNLNRTASNAALSIARFGEILGSSDDPSPFGGQIEEIPITTPTRARQSANQTSTVDYFRSLACITACQIAVRVVYESSQEATNTLETITAVIDDLLLKLGNETGGVTYGTYNIVFETSNIYTSLEEMRREFTKIMIDLGASLADIEDYEVPAEVMTTLNLSYDKYKDIDRADTIFERNKEDIKHPGFLPQGETIEILSA